LYVCITLIGCESGGGVGYAVYGLWPSLDAFLASLYLIDYNTISLEVSRLLKLVSPIGSLYVFGKS